MTVDRAGWRDDGGADSAVTVAKARKENDIHTFTKHASETCNADGLGNKRGLGLG